MHSSRPKFRFEAKRLGPQHPVGKYTGSEGLGAFLSNYYPLTHQEAGMLAYIQSKDHRHWSSKIEDALKLNPDAFDLLDVCDCFPEKPIIKGLSTHRTTHTISGNQLTIWHTFLLFH